MNKRHPLPVRVCVWAAAIVWAILPWFVIWMWGRYVIA